MRYHFRILNKEEGSDDLTHSLVLSTLFIIIVMLTPITLCKIGVPWYLLWHTVKV